MKKLIHILKVTLTISLMSLFAFCQSPNESQQKSSGIESDTIAHNAEPSLNGKDSVLPETADTAIVAVEAPDDVVLSDKNAGAPKPQMMPAAPATLPSRSAVRGDGSGFSDIQKLDPSILLDIRYATSNNFTHAQIYDCPACLLRPEAATALVKVHQSLVAKGYGGLKMFDCYRPRPYQQRLWDKVPNPNYVTPPAKGSMHSRGAAVDLTIVDKAGKELNMGTAYDFFGRQAHFDYLQLPAQILANRKLLPKEMEAQAFKGIRTEWWHFSYRGETFALSDYLWKCD